MINVEINGGNAGSYHWRCGWKVATNGAGVVRVLDDQDGGDVMDGAESGFE